MAQSVAYLPTGDRNTSAMMIQKVFPNEAIVGKTFDYTICATNLTNMTLVDVVVKDAVPSNYKVASTDPKAEMGGNNMLFRLGDVGPRQTRTIKVSGAAGGSGQVLNCSSVSWDNSICMAVNIVQPSIKVTRTATPEVTPCDSVLVKIDVTNTGSGVAESVKLTDTLGAGLTTADGKTGALTLDAGNIGPGQTKSFPLTLKASKTGVYTNTTTATANGGLTATSNQTTTTVKAPVLTMKAECTGTSYVGRTVIGRFTVKNTGDMGAQNTQVVATLPTNAKFMSADTTGAMAGGKVTWNLGTLARRRVQDRLLHRHPQHRGHPFLLRDGHRHLRHRRHRSVHGERRRRRRHRELAGR